MRYHRKLLNIHQVITLTGLNRPSVYSMMNKGEFPGIIIETEQYSGWDEDDVQEWLLKQLCSSKEGLQVSSK